MNIMKFYYEINHLYKHINELIFVYYTNIRSLIDRRELYKSMIKKITFIKNIIYCEWIPIISSISQ